MEVCKNKSSGQYFIYVHESGNGERLFVTPNAGLKSLKTDLFSSLEELSEEWLLRENFITAEQIQRLHEYENNRSDDQVENIEYLFDQMSTYEQELFIAKLQKKLNK